MIMTTGAKCSSKMIGERVSRPIMVRFHAFCPNDWSIKIYKHILSIYHKYFVYDEVLYCKYLIAFYCFQ